MKLRSNFLLGLALAAAVGWLAYSVHAQNPAANSSSGDWTPLDTELDALARAAQDKQAAAPASQAATEKPAPEHALLAKWVGTWDTEITAVWTGSSEKYKGVRVCRMIGAYWLVCESNSTLGGTPVVGHEIDGWDGTKKEFTSVWIDSTGSQAATGEGSFDAAKKTMTMNLQMPMGATSVPMTTVYVWKDDNTVSGTTSAVGQNGKLSTIMTIDFKRRS